MTALVAWLVARLLDVAAFVVPFVLTLVLIFLVEPLWRDLSRFAG